MQNRTNNTSTKPVGHQSVMAQRGEGGPREQHLGRGVCISWYCSSAGIVHQLALPLSWNSTSAGITRQLEVISWHCPSAGTGKGGVGEEASAGIARQLVLGLTSAGILRQLALGCLQLEWIISWYGRSGSEAH